MILICYILNFSEPAVNPVTVNCFVSSESSANANSMQLKFLQATVQQQQTQTTVCFLYRFHSRSAFLLNYLSLLSCEI